MDVILKIGYQCFSAHVSGDQMVIFPCNALVWQGMQGLYQNVQARKR